LGVRAGDRLLEVGVVSGDRLAVREDDLAAGDAFEAGAGFGCSGKGVAGGAAVCPVEGLAACDQGGCDLDWSGRGLWYAAGNEAAEEPAPEPIRA
jgi:hypothetical protein